MLFSHTPPPEKSVALLKLGQRAKEQFFYCIISLNIYNEVYEEF